MLCVFSGVWPRVLGYAMEEGGWGATVLLQSPPSSPPLLFFFFLGFCDSTKETLHQLLVGSRQRPAADFCAPRPGLG